MRDSTIQYYNDHAAEYVTNTLTADLTEIRLRFLKNVPAGGKILDAGCGSGRDTIAFLNAGYDVEAFDASEEMCRLASERTGIHVEKKCFEELDGEEAYDGIWACASLLHVNKQELPDVLKRLYRLLKPEGVLYASFKQGAGERVKGSRYFYDMDENECAGLMKNAGFIVLESFQTGDTLPGRESERWINTIVKKHAD